MIGRKFNESWKFWVEKNSFALEWNIPNEARDISLPHDAMIENAARPDSPNRGNTGYRDGGIYNYVKLFDVPPEYADKTVMLKFEGIYMNAFVYINGELAGKCPYGYSTFYVQMNPYLRYGEKNEIRVVVRNGSMTNSRWYSGGGIYRDVYLLVSDLTYMVQEGTQIITESIEDEYAVVSVSTELINRYHTLSELTLKTVIKDAEGVVIASEDTAVALYEQEKRKMHQRIVIDKPRIWSENTPDLYTCVSTLYHGTKLMDEGINQFGIRTLQVDAKRGLRVNGKTVKLRGACIHHDSGLLGAATYDDAQYRQIRLLKAAGFNAVRMSHHPMAQSMLRACDELGIYVMDEAFDMWIRCKSEYDYGMYFQEWWEKDVEAMVRKDFNHPSVILYSLGNEIPEIGNNQGVEICSKLSEKVKSLDSTRFTLASINGVFAAGDAVGKIIGDIAAEVNKEGSAEGNVNNFMTMMDKHMDKIVAHPEITKRLEKACAVTDIAGYNYMAARYKEDGIKYPNRVIVGSETSPPETAKTWGLVETCEHVIGDFTWTGWDYIGEAGIGIASYQLGEGGMGASYPCQLAYCGDIDITGFRRPASYFREIIFGLRKNPYITVQDPDKYGAKLLKTPWSLSDSIPSWTWEDCEGKNVIIEVYAPGEEVEVLCNGKSLGRKAAGKVVGYITYFKTIYEPGTLTAISYENQTEIGRTDLATTDAECNLVILPEEENTTELIYVPMEIHDKYGNIVMDKDVKLEITAEGGADIIGFGSGNPKPIYNYTERITETFHGRALAVLKKNGKVSTVTITVSSDKYPEVTTTLHI